MTLTAELQHAGREPALPLQLPLGEGAELCVEQWLRVLPGKRLVARARQGERTVLLKLFVAAGAARHSQRELAGVEVLREQGVRTPVLLAEGEIEGGGRYLISEFLVDANSLQQRWDALASRQPGDPQAMALLGQALALIGNMHSKGLVQTDLHLGNFLLQADQLYVIDGDAVEAQTPGQPLTAEAAQQNLAIFFAQLPSEWDELTELLLIDYLQHNPLALNPDTLAASIEKVRHRRQEDYLGKSLRDCTLFSVQRTWTRFTASVRTQTQRLSALLSDPNQCFIAQPLLKDGGSSTVVKVESEHGDLVVKRYNIKSLGHWLSRFWRPSRAWHSWLAAHRLQFLGISTPAPLAMIERRFGPLRMQAWLITEFCAGENLLQHFGEEGGREPNEEEAAALLGLFERLRRSRISHGDCKATNLLWHAGNVVLIDLDAMQQHDSNGSTWIKAWETDRARFIRNWPTDSLLAQWLEDRLPGSAV
ncbi:lipopolysaccharide kinase InaA family protein [Pseudomonas neustonica]|uniref:lipopolysaccharide kinase InaA family protein n=1 Tax=Pseudomonas neustonica TaxID=2487346 RepID=UPI003F4514F0